MAYSDDEAFAKFCNFISWDAYAASGKYPIKATLTEQREQANSILNQWIGSFNVDITDLRFIKWLKQKEMQLMRRIQQEEKTYKTTEPATVHMPHDYLYQQERDYCKMIGLLLGYRVPGAVG